MSSPLIEARSELISDIARRVRPAVPEMPEEEFDGLVARMADLELRYRRRMVDDLARPAVRYDAS